MAEKTGATLDIRSRKSDRDFVPDMTGAGEEVIKPSLLLHSCCGPCSTACIERLASDYSITVFFYYPCIDDQDEYRKRKEAQIRMIRDFNMNHLGTHKIGFIEGRYDFSRYTSLTQGYDAEPGGASRNRITYRMMLDTTAKTAKEKGFCRFATSLTVSPHRDYSLISSLGKDISRSYDLEYLDTDFSREGGFQRSIDLAEEYGLDGHDYCGCIYSEI